jgi:RND superfamily putative drug exporter
VRGQVNQVATIIQTMIDAFAEIPRGLTAATSCVRNVDVAAKLVIAINRLGGVDGPTFGAARDMFAGSARWRPRCTATPVCDMDPSCKPDPDPPVPAGPGP